MTALRFVDPDDPANDQRSFGDWLRRWRQDRRAIDAIWDLIVRPTINLTSERGVTGPGGARLPGSACSSRPTRATSATRSSRCRRSTTPPAVRRWLAPGSTCGCRAAAAAIVPDDDGFSVRLAGGDALRAGHVIVAVPHGRARRAAARRRAPSTATPGSGSAARRSSTSTSSTTGRVLELPFAAGIDSPGAMGVRPHRRLGPDRRPVPGRVAVGRRRRAGVPASELRERYLSALAELLPGGRATRRSGPCFVTRDHAATFRAAPGQRALRPGPATALPGLVLAGAWTDTGWPATMEGAVRSGHAAAERDHRGGFAPAAGAAARHASVGRRRAAARSRC